MAVFSYRALRERDSAVEGTISADTARTARDLLRGRGLIVETISTQTENKTHSLWPFRRRTRHAAKRVAAVRELSTLLSAGIPLLEAVDSLASQYKT